MFLYAFLPKRVKENNHFNNHLHFAICAFHHEWSLVHQQNVTSSYPGNHFRKKILIQLITFSSFFLHVSCKIVTPRYQEGGGWTASLCTYLGPVSHLIQFTPCQHLGLMWRHLAMIHFAVWNSCNYSPAKPSAHI